MKATRFVVLGFFLMTLFVAGSGHTATSVTGFDPANTAQLETFVNTLLGVGVSLVSGSVTLTGVNNQQGTFTGGLSSIGFNSGMVLSSGLATGLPGSNAGQPAETLGNGASGTANLSTDLGTAGYAALTTLAGVQTNDANVLSFRFKFGDGTSVNNSLFFNYVFGSEEYIDYVNSQYNDVFGFFVDGQNIALVGGNPITINNINPNSNSAFYVNNVNNTNGYAVNAGRLADIKVDGLTTVLTAQKTGLGAGEHTMTFAVADGSDHILDALVFIQEGTFSNQPTQVPEPATMTLLFAGLLGLAGLKKRFVM